MTVSRRSLWWTLSLAGAVGWVFLAAWGSSPGGPLVCLFRRTLELPCAGCGLTRAFARMASGDLYGSVILHPLAPLLLAEAVCAWALWGLWAHGRMPGWLGSFVARHRDEVLLGTGLLLVALWLGRLAVGDLSPF